MIDPFGASSLMERLVLCRGQTKWIREPPSIHADFSQNLDSDMNSVFLVGRRTIQPLNTINLKSLRVTQELRKKREQNRHQKINKERNKEMK